MSAAVGEGHPTRSFLACWPGQVISKRLAQCARQMRDQVGGRVTRRENLHVTLAFLGGLTAAQLTAVAACCPPPPRRFTLDLDRTGYWKKRGIVWIGAKSPDPDFKDFVEDLRHRLRRLGCRIESRPFVPHITILRQARRRPRFKLDSQTWIIDEYTLVASELASEGARYSVSKRWSTNGDVK